MCGLRQCGWSRLRGFGWGAKFFGLGSKGVDNGVLQGQTLFGSEGFDATPVGVGKADLNRAFFRSWHSCMPSPLLCVELIRHWPGYDKPLILCNLTAHPSIHAFNAINAVL